MRTHETALASFADWIDRQGGKVLPLVRVSNGCSKISQKIKCIRICQHYRITSITLCQYVHFHVLIVICRGQEFFDPFPPFPPLVTPRVLKKGQKMKCIKICQLYRITSITLCQYVHFHILIVTCRGTGIF